MEKLIREISGCIPPDSAFEYYKQHLEKYNAAFAAQVNEFREGNLLFEIMQRKIWNRSAADSAGLKKYFEKHAESYWWKPGAEAIIFNVPNQSSAKKLAEALKKDVNNWRKDVDSLGGQIQADSGRFELKQIPGNKPVRPVVSRSLFPIRLQTIKIIQYNLHI